MKEKKLINILINSFSEVKFSLYDYINHTKNLYSKQSKIYLGNKKKNLFHNYFNNFLLMPLANEKNKKIILTKLKSKNIGIVIPTSDLELIFWSKNKLFFEKNNITTMIMDFQNIKNFINKEKFYYYCKQNNIDTPKIYKDKNFPRKGSFVIKEKFSNDKTEICLNLKYKELNNYLKNFKDPIIQECLKGDEYSIDTWKNEKTKKIEMVVRKRLFIKNGESKITEISKNKKLLNLIFKQLKKFEYFYHCVFQGLLKKNKFFFLECNPRVGGASLAALNHSLKSFHYFFSEYFKKKIIKTTNKRFKKQYKFETVYYK